MDAVSDHKAATVGRAEPSPSGRGQGEGADDHTQSRARQQADSASGAMPTARRGHAGSDEKIKITPTRYAKSYLDWLGEKRDWCIGRQLWWGHRVPVWTGKVRNKERFTESLQKFLAHYKVPVEDTHFQFETSGRYRLCVKTIEAETAMKLLEELHAQRGMRHVEIVERQHLQSIVNDLKTSAESIYQDDDVLDTWFSSALWPMSTLGWPGPALPDKPKGPANPEWSEQKYYYPTSVLITSREIITLWVARMVLMGLYNLGEIPFHDVYIHPKILDGSGETMSKSKGNGVDPLDIHRQIRRRLAPLRPRLHVYRNARCSHAGRVRMPALPKTRRANAQKSHAPPRELHPLRQALLDPMGRQTRRYCPLPRRRRQRTLRAVTQFLQ